MALKACRECGKQVSTQVTGCPNCGAPTKGRIGRGKLIAIVFLVIFVIIAVIGESEKRGGKHYNKGYSEKSKGRASSDREAERISKRLRELGHEFGLDDFGIYLVLLKSDGFNVSIIDEAFQGKDKNEVVIRVKDLWHFLPYQIRLQNAQRLMLNWIKLRLSEEATSINIRIVDLMGNEVGGSSKHGRPSELWVRR